MLPSLILPLVAPGLAANPAAAAANAPLIVILSLAVTLVTGVVLAGAILRASLQPDERRHLYLRLGPQEGWLALTMLALLAFWIVAFFLLVFLLSLGGGRGRRRLGKHDDAAGWCPVAVVYLVVNRREPSGGSVRFGPVAADRLQRAQGRHWRGPGARPGTTRADVAVAGPALTARLLAVYAEIVGRRSRCSAASIPLQQLRQTLQTDPTALSGR
jgi:hypothetical protein